MQILRYTESVQKQVGSKTKPEPWLHCAIINKRYFAIYVWDTRQVIEQGSMRAGKNGKDVTGTMALDNHQPLQGLKGDEASAFEDAFAMRRHESNAKDFANAAYVGCMFTRYGIKPVGIHGGPDKSTVNKLVESWTKAHEHDKKYDDDPIKYTGGAVPYLRKDMDPAKYLAKLSSAKPWPWAGSGQPDEGTIKKIVESWSTERPKTTGTRKMTRGTGSRR